jgi:hypothetical protein
MKIVGQDYQPLCRLPDGTGVKWEKIQIWKNQATNEWMLGYSLRYTQKPLAPEHFEAAKGDDPLRSFFCVMNAAEGLEVEPTMYSYETYCREYPLGDMADGTLSVETFNRRGVEA